VEGVTLDSELAKLFGGDLLTGGVLATIEAGAHDEAATIGRISDEIDDGFVGPQRSAAPVDRDEREEAMLDLVPLAGAGREMTDVDGEIELDLRYGGCPGLGGLAQLRRSRHCPA
jgi:hypothetical protein